MKYLDSELGVHKVSLKDYSRKAKIYLVLKTIFHAVCLVHHFTTDVFGVLILLKGLDHEKEIIRFMAKHILGFGTLWNFGFQMAFLSLALLHDLLEWTGRHHSTLGGKVAYWRDVVFSGLLVPYTWFVTLMFWTLWIIDRELVFPEIFDAVVPFWFNHCVHTNIFIIFWIETILEARRKPRDFKMETIFYVFIGISYAIVYYGIYFISGRYLYYVFAIMTWWQVCLFQCLIWFSSYVFYTIQFPINRIFHGKEGSEVQEEQNTRGVEEVRSADRESNTKDATGVSETEVLNEADPRFAKSWSREYRSSRGQDNTSL